MNKENVLLVEGPDDKSAIQGLLDKHSVIPNFKIVIAGGIEKLLQTLNHLVAVPIIERFEELHKNRQRIDTLF